MRRTLAVLVCMVAILGLLAPAAFAQAPAPKVTINGLFDQVTSAGKNIYDGNFARTGDTEWYARVRFRPDFTFEVGRTKAVLGLEMDLQYGQAGPNDGGFPGNVTGAANHKAGAGGGFDLNTDVAGLVELKWMYTEFDLTGKDSLLPFIPVGTVARVGAQPFATLATYKATYATGDFAGIAAVTTWAPNLKTNLAFVMVEDELARFSQTGTLAAVAGKPTRGNDYAVILSPEFTPFKGLDIKPMYSYFHAEGITNGSARRGATNINTSSAAPGTFTPGGSVGGTTAYQLSTRYGAGDPLLQENRHTIGVDARWRSGPFSLDPTVFYQWGTRDNVIYNGPTGTNYQARNNEATMSSWLVDIQGGWQLGPLLLEARGIYSTGNKARDNLGQRIKYFEPLDLDTNYYINWAQILALGVDYFNGGGGTALGMSTNIGYDRYGRAQFGVRATYSITPELAIWGIVSPTWTAEKVDTDTTVNAAGTARVCSRAADVGGTCFVEGDDRYIGTEVNLGTTWRFAPNTAFDLVGGYLFAGSALDTRQCNTATGGGGGNPFCQKEDASDAWTVAARVRLSF